MPEKKIHIIPSYGVYKWTVYGLGADGKSYVKLLSGTAKNQREAEALALKAQLEL